MIPREISLEPLPLKHTQPTQMKDRQEHIDFDRNYCTHYEPKPGASLNVDYCALGCGASALMKKARETGGEPRMAPCIGGHESKNVLAICPKWQRRSLEHAEARADRIEESRRRMTLVGLVVSAWRKKEPMGKSEVIECPACKGRLHLSQSAYNGHVHGKCATPNCVNWLE